MEKPFGKERLTFRLDMLAHEAIDANDGVFSAALGLTIREVRTLRLIHDNPAITFVELVRAADIERSLTSRIIQRLIKLGLVSRENDEDDARRFRLFTTEAGAQKRIAAGALSEALEGLLLAPLDAPDIRMLDSLLERLAIWIRSEDYRARLQGFLDQAE